MRVGLVGFSGSGKSTLFQLLTGADPDPGKVHAGQVGIATLTDPRLDYLAAMQKPRKVTPATVEMLDTPGLRRGTHGDNPQRLALIREGNALMIVLGAFAGTDPAADLAAFREEMLFADLDVVINRVERLEASVKKPRPDREAQLRELDVNRRIQAALEANQPIAALGLSEEERKPVRSFGLLTDKPQVVILNTISGQGVPDSVRTLAPDATAIDAKLEFELSQLEEDERAAFMADLGLTGLGRDRIIRKAYEAVGMITFFTVGDPEARGWNLERGGTALDAAGKVHTDLARGFIRAEVTAFDDLHRLGSMKEVKAQNLLKVEGKNYVVKDGDILFIRSSL